MIPWSEIEIPQQLGEEPKLWAVAYYRHSAQDLAAGRDIRDFIERVLDNRVADDLTRLPSGRC